MTMLKDIQELLEAEVISNDTAKKIQQYYQSKEGSSTNKLFAIFGVLGAILVGLGLILIIAHNWDDLLRSTKTILAFIPLLVGQLLCAFSLFKRDDSVAWRESSTAFLFFGIGACISLVSQIYNLPGELGGFILLWMLLSLPLVYAMKSSIVSLLFIVGITAYACCDGYFYGTENAYLFWPLLLSIFPHYYMLFKQKSNSNFMLFHNWLIPISLTIALGTLIEDHSQIITIGYMSLFGLFYLIGKLDFIDKQRIIFNGYKVIGVCGMIYNLLMYSYNYFWSLLLNKDYDLAGVFLSTEFIVSFLITQLAMVLFVSHIKSKGIKGIKPYAPIFILFFIIFLVGLQFPIAAILINLLVFVIGVLIIRDGANQNHLGVLNFGLLLITALVTCRFFDTDISFVLRGVMFLMVGLGFFATNFWMLKKRKENVE